MDQKEKLRSVDLTKLCEMSRNKWCIRADSFGRSRSYCEPQISNTENNYYEWEIVNKLIVPITLFFMDGYYYVAVTNALEKEYIQCDEVIVN